jgi:hypothetical protein
MTVGDRFPVTLKALPRLPREVFWPHGFLCVMAGRCAGHLSR